MLHVSQPNTTGGVDGKQKEGSRNKASLAGASKFINTGTKTYTPRVRGWTVANAHHNPYSTGGGEEEEELQNAEICIIIFLYSFKTLSFVFLYLSHLRLSNFR